MPTDSDDGPILIRVENYHDIRTEAIEQTELPNHRTAERIVDQMGADWFAAVIDALDEYARINAVADFVTLDAPTILDAAGEALETDPENTCGARAEWEPPSGLSNAEIVTAIEGQYKRRQAIAARQASDTLANQHAERTDR